LPGREDGVDEAPGGFDFVVRGKEAGVAFIASKSSAGRLGHLAGEFGER